MNSRGTNQTLEYKFGVGKLTTITTMFNFFSSSKFQDHVLYQICLNILKKKVNDWIIWRSLIGQRKTPNQTHHCFIQLFVLLPFAWLSNAISYFKTNKISSVNSGNPSTFSKSFLEDIRTKKVRQSVRWAMNCLGSQEKLLQLKGSW